MSLDKLRICYLDPFKPLLERRQFLRDNYFFVCECERCLEEEVEVEGEEEEVRLAREQGEAFLAGQLEEQVMTQVVREVTTVLGEYSMLSLRASKLLFNMFLERAEVAAAVEWGMLCWASYRHHVALNPPAYVQTLLKLANALRLQGGDYVSVVTEVHAVCRTFFQADKYITYYTNIVKNMTSISPGIK